MAKVSSRTSTPSEWPTHAEPIGREAVRSHQRERILRATVTLVSKRGFDDTSLDRICKEAGVSFPTFRKHFRDKEEAFLAAFDEIVAGWEEKAIARATGAGDWGHRIAAGLAALLEAIVAEPARARICLVESLGAGPSGIERYEDGVRRLVPILREGRAYMKNPQALPPVMEETIAGGVAWTLHKMVAAGEAAEVPALLHSLLETITAPYLGSTGAADLIESLAEAPAAG